MARPLLWPGGMTEWCDRPRERLWAHGGERVTTEELLALVLGTGAPGATAVEVAREMLCRVGGVVALARASPREMVSVTGVGAARAARVAAAFHLGRRALEAERPDDRALTSPGDAYQRLRPRMGGLSQEIFVVLALDARNLVLDEIEVARGHLCGVDVHPREVFRPLIRQAAAAAIVAHNHPSGDPEPSPEDLALTHRLRAVGDVVGIPILDHLVIGDGRYVSIAALLP